MKLGGSYHYRRKGMEWQRRCNLPSSLNFKLEGNDSLPREWGIKVKASEDGQTYRLPAGIPIWDSWAEVQYICLSISVLIFFLLYIQLCSLHTITIEITQRINLPALCLLSFLHWISKTKRVMQRTILLKETNTVSKCRMFSYYCAILHIFYEVIKQVADLSMNCKESNNKCTHGGLHRYNFKLCRFQIHLQILT